MTDTNAKLLTSPPGAQAAGGICDTANEVIDGHGFSEGLKVTNTPEAIVANKRIIGGSEDCIDIVRTGHAHIRDSCLVASERTRTFITAKGGGQRLIFSGLLFIGDTRWWDVSLGDWTIYNQDPTLPPMRQAIFNDCRHIFDEKILILQLFCDQVILHNTSARVLNLRRFAPLFFRVLRHVRTPDPRAKDAHRPWLK